MTIVVNGREYDSLEQMPPEVRQEYLQAMRAPGGAKDSGVPDVLQEPGASNAEVSESFIYNGQEYASRDELPTEVREMLDQMPEPQPSGDETRLEIKTTKVFPPKVIISERSFGDGEFRSAGAKPGFPSWLVTALVVALLALFFLWFSGIRPADLWRR
jgi:hypothetical protein